MRRRRKKQSWKLAMILFAFICYSMIAWNIQAGAGDEDIVVLEEGATRADIQRLLCVGYPKAAKLYDLITNLCNNKK